MTLTDITAVFSRSFIVGFFLPAFVSLVLLWRTASSEFVPNLLDERHSETAKLLIVGGVALVGGLVLSGISYQITRFFEGYPLERRSHWPVVGSVYQAAVGLQGRRYDRLLAIREDESKSDKEVEKAALTLDRFFPKDRKDLLPTRLGNAIRAFEQHSNDRWGLDGVTIWPRIEALLSADDRELVVNSAINFNVFINACVGALVVGACLVYDEAVNAPQPASFWPLYAIPFVLAYALYWAAINPATEWGDSVRASIDLHRLEIYEKLGVRSPTSFSDERALAESVNEALLYGHPLLSDDLWRAEKVNDEKSGGTAKGWRLTFLKKCPDEGE